MLLFLVCKRNSYELCKTVNEHCNCWTKLLLNHFKRYFKTAVLNGIVQESGAY